MIVMLRTVDVGTPTSLHRIAVEQGRCQALMTGVSCKHSIALHREMAVLSSHWLCVLHRNIGVPSNAEAPDNPLNIVRRIYRSGDYVAFKLDIDNAPIELVCFHPPIRKQSYSGSARIISCQNGAYRIKTTSINTICNYS